MSPWFGPTNCKPSDKRVDKFRLVAKFSHILTFIAGATKTGLSVAKMSVEARSFAEPFAIFDIKSAVHGAIITKSADRESSMWPISDSSVKLKRSK